MAKIDYEVGYGKPPKSTRFKAGVSGNPKGRPKRETWDVGEIVEEILNAPIRYRERGRNKTASREEVTLRLLIERAVAGDVPSADLLMKVRARALRQGGARYAFLEVTDWLPDYPGQSGEQKTREFVGGREGDTTQSQGLHAATDQNPAPDK
jgi:hypothetical protein